MRERASERSKDEDGKEEGSSLVSRRGVKAFALLPVDDGDPGGRNERCKVIKANVHHLVGDLKARNFL